MPIVEKPTAAMLSSPEHHIREYKEFVDLIHADPCGMAQFLFGIELWSGYDPRWYSGRPGQAEVLKTLFTHNADGSSKRLVVPSGHTTGKTYLSHVAPILWLLAHPYSFVIMTSQSWSHIENMMFPGMASVLKRCVLGNIFPKVFSDKWVLGDKWAAIGLSPSIATTFQSWHSSGITVGDISIPGGTFALIDEGAELERSLFDAIISLLQSEHDAIMFIGNPTRSDGAFVEKIRDPTWENIQLDDFYTPNVICQREVIPGLCKQSFIDEMRHEHGEGQAQFNSRVRGIPPDQDVDTFVSFTLFQQAKERPERPRTGDGDMRMGVDVATAERGDRASFLIGGDTTLQHLEEHRGWKEPDIRSHILKLMAEWDIHPRNLAIDATGLGSSVCDNLERDHDFPPTIRVVNGATAHDYMHYANRKSECWGNAKRALEAGYCIPARFHKDLRFIPMVHYRNDSKSRIMVEKSDDIRKRTRVSPDNESAFVMLFSRAVGDAAFPAAHRKWHALARQPAIRFEQRPGKRPICELSLLGSDFPPRQGRLLRASWLARSSESACIWVHEDDDGCWTVVDSARSFGGENPRLFWARVIEKSKGHSYRTDVFSTAEDYQYRGEAGMSDYLYDLTMELGGVSCPDYMTGAHLHGVNGLAQLDRMLLSTRARVLDDPFWTMMRERGFGERERYLDPRQLYIWPDDVLESLLYARRRPGGRWWDDPEEQDNESLVASGGPFVICLRLLAIAG